MFGQPIQIAVGYVSVYAETVKRTGMRTPDAPHLGQPVMGMGSLCEARRCVWPARSTPLNWEGRLGATARICV